VNTDYLFRALRDLLRYQLSPAKASSYSASLDKSHIRWVGVEDEDSVGQHEERMRMYEWKERWDDVETCASVDSSQSVVSGTSCLSALFPSSYANQCF